MPAVFTQCKYYKRDWDHNVVEFSFFWLRCSYMFFGRWQILRCEVFSHVGSSVSVLFFEVRLICKRNLHKMSYLYFAIETHTQVFHVTFKQACFLMPRRHYVLVRRRNKFSICVEYAGWRQFSFLSVQSVPAAGLLRVVQLLSTGSVGLDAAVPPQEAGGVMTTVLSVDTRCVNTTKKTEMWTCLNFSFLTQSTHGG